MSIEVETVVAVSVMMAVFSAVAAVGTSIVLGAGFERLRSGFEVIRKQTGFFSDAIYKLEEKMEIVDDQAGKFSHSIAVMETKVSGVGEQANAFNDSMQRLEKKVDIVDKQAGFFGDAIHRLENKVDNVSAHEEKLSEKVDQHANAEVISVGKTEALVSHAEELLLQMGELAEKMSENNSAPILSYSDVDKGRDVSAHSFAHYTHMPAVDAPQGGMGYN